MPKEKVVVDICGIPFSIETDDIDPIELQAIAKEVEAEITAIRNNSNEQTLSKIAILACLNIASELFRWKMKYENFNYSVNKKTEELINKIDNILNS
jgi:cell division protein ZapA (FtsZ GTPase activity inhibitor)